MRSLQIFRSGTHVASNGESLTFTDADLAASVSAYDPQLHEAPIVVGHPKQDAPAYGWIKNLDYTDGVMSAEPDQVDALFAEMVGAGRFKKISASFYCPQSKSNPTPGVYYLRHVGFLGAAAPAVKGLKSAEFSGDDNDIIEFGWSETDNASLWRQLRDWLIEKFSLEEADKVVPSYLVESLTREAAIEEPHNYSDPTEIDVDKAEIARRQADIDAKERKLKADKEAQDARDAEFTERENALAVKERKARETEVIEYVDGLIGDGKLMPRFKTSLTAALVALPGEPIEFAEGDATVKKAPGDLLREIFNSLPKQIEFSEVAGNAGGKPQELTPKQIATKAGALVDEESAKGRSLSYTEAVGRVMAAEGATQ